MLYDTVWPTVSGNGPHFTLIKNILYHSTKEIHHAPHEPELNLQSQERIPEKLHIKPNPDGGVTIQIGNATDGHTTRRARSRLSTQDIENIKQRYATDTETQAAIAKDFNISHSMVGLIVNGKKRAQG